MYRLLYERVLNRMNYCTLQDNVQYTHVAQMANCHFAISTKPGPLKVIVVSACSLISKKEEQRTLTARLSIYSLHT